MGRRRVLRHDRWAQGQAGDGNRVTLVLAGTDDSGVAARGGGVSRALRRGPGAPGVSGAEWGAVAGGRNRAAGERPHGARHRLHLRSGAVSRGGMGLREGNGAHHQSAETLERSATALTPTEAGPALRSRAACGTSETPVLPACS